MPEPSKPRDESMRRMQWRCRRGMRELDVLLERYLRWQYETAGPQRQQAFADLLELPDPELHALLIGRNRASEEAVRDVIRAIVQSPARSSA